VFCPRSMVTCRQMTIIQQTFKLKLRVPDTVQVEQTRIEYAQAFDAVAVEGWTSGCTNGVELHHRTYRDLRSKLSLPSQLVITARMKAVESIKATKALKKLGKKVSCPKMTNPSVRFDARCYRIDWKSSEALLTLCGGRVRVPFHVDRQAAKFVGLKTCSADLVKRRRGWFLHIVVEVEVPNVPTTGRAVGVDRGIRKPAVTSDGLFLGKPRWRDIEEKALSLKSRLQAKGTRSATRHLKKVGAHLARFRRDCDHVLSKHLVASCEPGDTLVLEKLDGIRDSAKARHGAPRRRLHAWSFRRIGDLLRYKAALRGVVAAEVDPRDTSRRCPQCGLIDKRNRKDQSHFRCISCSFSRPADLVAAWNIRDLYEGTWAPAPRLPGRVNDPNAEPSSRQAPPFRAG